MNKFISLAFVVCALASSVHCSGYGSSYGSSAAAPASAYNANSYILGPGPVGYAAAAAPAVYAGPSYSAHSYSAPAFSSPAKPSGPKYTVQPAYAHELFPGRFNYKTYHSAPTYSQVALPVLPSSPLAKLYIPAAQSYAAPAASYAAAPVASYGGGY
ncbi:chorion protein 19 isoform 2-T2 [Cochliomyia hominivorax]